MLRSLTLKLVLGFLFISVTGAALAGIFAHRATVLEFNQLVLEQGRTNFVAEATVYYMMNGSWQGVLEYLRSGAIPPGQLPAPQQPLNPPPGQPAVQNSNFQDRPLAYVLTSQDGHVITPIGGYRRGELVPEDILAEGTPIEVDGEVVGIVVTSGSPPELDPREEVYLQRTNQILFSSGIAAAIIAIILGVILARTFTRPIKAITKATRSVASGDLNQRVTVKTNDELGELAQAFNQMSADLDRANHLRQQMTADIAHDLRTPLTVISGYIESLQDGVLDPTPERFDIIQNEVQQLQRLVEDLRTLSLADAGELSLNLQPTALGGLLERMVSTYQLPAQSKQITLRAQTQPGLNLLNIDPERMNQVLGNLLTNALRYTPDGGQIVLSARQEPNSVSIRIQDNGAGIAPEFLPHIFDRFFRSDRARHQQSGETGLGLAIARSIVEAHGGSISVDSQPDQGTTFTITLPN